MDDVDRLFQCFRCGISPPQSAVKEKRKDKHKLKQDKSPPASSISGKKSVNLRSSRQFSPVVFYGSPNGVPPKRPARLLRLLREIRVDLSEQNKLRARAKEQVWSTFPRQDEAIKFAKQHTNARIFSYQDHMNGQRRFLVSTYKEFWPRYKEMNSKFRHHYEVIQEGLPCHLYFDLEFKKRENAGRNGDEMVDLLIAMIFEALFEKYAIQGNEDCVLELDSSTEEKFSRHLVIHLPNTAFKDNSHAGAFVTEVCSRIESYRGKDENYEKLFVSKGSTSSAVRLSSLFVDTAVYTRNRCFRLPFSSKAGKTSFLLPSGRFMGKIMDEEEVFMASLICNMDANTDKLLICKMDLECVKALHFETEISNNIEDHSNRFEKFDPYACSSHAPETYLSGKSPFPSLDAFVEAIASTGNISGKIRAWYWFKEDGLMVYSMSRNRYCERIGREHKSNHVIYVVDLRRADYYQKCHDPDCRGYRSPLHPVPDGIIPYPTIHENLLGDNNDNMEYTNPAGDENSPGSCKIEEWWGEAARVAQQIEEMQTDWVLTHMDGTSEEEENWWMVAESAASQREAFDPEPYADPVHRVPISGSRLY